jgi:hypothetical protein
MPVTRFCVTIFVQVGMCNEALGDFFFFQKEHYVSCRDIFATLNLLSKKRASLYNFFCITSQIFCLYINMKQKNAQIRE